MSLNIKLDPKKKMIYLITGIFSLLFISSFYSHKISADNLSSPTYEIQMGTINITGGRKSNENGTIILTDTVGQTFQGQFNSDGYVIMTGFQYINTLTPFSFAISDLDINFGNLVPEIPSLDSNTLTITTGSAFGYSVKAIEDHPLRASDNDSTIPDTSCDLATPCLQADANQWIDDTRDGFGYNMSGDDVDTDDFEDSNFYRPFPVQNIDEPAIVMSKNGMATVSAAIVTYKVNVTTSQESGTYQNAIQYIAIPAF